MSVVIVGGGATGLVAAIEMAELGREVTLLESSPRFGGRAQSHAERDFVMNLGPHALYAFAEDRLRELGVAVEGGVPAKGLTMQLGDRLAELPIGARSLLGSGGLSWSDKVRFGSLLGRLGRIDAKALDHVSVAHWLDGLKATGALRQLLLANVRISSYVNAPDELSAGVAVRQLRAATRGVRYIDGGWQAIVRGLEARADAMGVARRSGARVVSLEMRRDRVCAVHLRDGERIAVDGLLLTLSPKACVRLLGAQASESLRRFASEATAVRAACLDVALDKLPYRHPSLILGTDQPTYLSVHSNVARLAPDGGGLVHVARYLAPGEKIRPETRRELERLLDLSQPGWREVTLRARWAPAMTVMHALPAARFGGASGRPRSSEGGPANVALAGDWVGPEHLLFDACLASAREAALGLSRSVGSEVGAKERHPDAA